MADIVRKIRNACDFIDLCAIHGYYAEEHIVQTTDGYLLGLHRLAWRKGEEGLRVNSGPASLRKNVVYLHHGWASFSPSALSFLLNSLHVYFLLTYCGAEKGSL